MLLKTPFSLGILKLSSVETFYEIGLGERFTGRFSGLLSREPVGITNKRRQQILRTKIPKSLRREGSTVQGFPLLNDERCKFVIIRNKFTDFSTRT